MEDKNIVIVDETTIYEVDGACVEEMRTKKKEKGPPQKKFGGMPLLINIWYI